MLPVMRVTWTSALALTLFASSAAAQGGHGGVSGSGIGQGEARITSRSDVRLSMESLPGTGSAAMTALGQRVGARMATIRGCYEARVAENPTVTGTLRLRWLLDAQGPARVEIDRDEVGDAPVRTCITRALEGLDASGLARPTRAVVQLQLANTAARAAEQTAERAQEAQQVTLSTDADGNPTSSGGTTEGHVRFTLTGEGAASGPAVAAAHRGVLSVLPGLLDCRRRAGRRGRSPGGELSAVLQVQPGRSPTSRVTASTVPNEQTRTCVSRVLGRIEHRATEGRGNVRARIQFAPSDDVSEARD
jgi:hypothetical protein